MNSEQPIAQNAQKQNQEEKNMRKKLLSAFLCLAMSTTLLAGCGSSGGSDKTGNNGSNGKVSLKVWAAEEDQTLTKDLIEKFEKANPDQKFDITVGVESEATAKDTILADPEAAPDVFAFANDQIVDLVKAGVLQEVQDTETISNENVESSVESATVDGKLYAYPFSADNGYFLFYDKNVISEEDVKNWDTLLKSADAAKKKVGMVLASGWYLSGFYYGAGFTTELNEDGSTTIDWNGTSADGVKGTDVTQSILDIAKNPAFFPVTDGDSTNQISSGKLAAIVSGTWDAVTASKQFGDGYAATILPTYTCAGEKIQMADAAGFKMMGVSKNSSQVGWAMELAKYLTNEESQQARFEEREIGPSNIKVGETAEVAENKAIAAVTEQNATAGVVQQAGGNFWDPAKSFGEILAQGNKDGKDLQKMLDNLVSAVAQPTD